MTAILEQYIRFCEDEEASIICPKCNTDIGQYVDAYDYYECGKCPICDCIVYGEETDGKHEWCKDCKYWCEGRAEIENQTIYDWLVDMSIKEERQQTADGRQQTQAGFSPSLPSAYCLLSVG